MVRLFYTFQSLGPHDFLTEGFSNEIAERLGGPDVRDYLSLAELREALRYFDAVIASGVVRASRAARPQRPCGSIREASRQYFAANAASPKAA
jgi:hypothetical protein